MWIDIAVAIWNGSKKHWILGQEKERLSCRCYKCEFYKLLLTYFVNDLFICNTSDLRSTFLCFSHGAIVLL